MEDFVERFKQQTEGISYIGIALGESSFSWSSCDTCGSQLGGDRYETTGMLDGDVVSMDSCVDCVMYIANGDIPEEDE